MKFCDLHVHSHFSDGTDSPAKIIKMAEEIGLSAVALCDHNTMDGVDQLLEAGKSSSVQTVAGIELSTDYGSTELHILGLFIPTEAYDKVKAYADALLDRKEESNKLMIGKIAEAGYEISFEDIRAKTPTGRFNRSHIATHLVEKGYVSDVKEAFATLIAKDSPYYVPVRRVDSLDAIRFLRSVGAVPVLAHPYLDLTEEELPHFLPMAVEAGLVGMEVYHPSHSKEQTEKAMELVKLHGLLPSGGSDYHGYRKPGIHLGTGEGNLQIPYSFCNNIEYYTSKNLR